MTKSKTGSLLLAGLAAYGLYKYSRMTPEDKTMLVDRIKTKGQEILDQVKPALSNLGKDKNMTDPSMM